MTASQYPGYRYSNAYDQFKMDPIRGFFAQILEAAQRVRPVTTQSDVFTREIQALVRPVYAGEKSPQAALEEANRRINQALHDAR